jgi:hypothetical protein
MDHLVRGALLLCAPGFDDGEEVLSACAGTTCTPLLGGMSNELFRLQRRGHSVVARVLADDLPPCTAQLDQDGLMRDASLLLGGGACPTAYGQAALQGLGGVRYEEYVEGRTMLVREYQQLQRAGQMGVILGRLHGLAATPGSLGIPAPAPGEGAPPVMLASRLLAYAAAAADCTPADVPAVDWTREASWLVDLLALVRPQCTLLGPERRVITHCDSQPGNWIVREGGGEGLTLIDYEYAVLSSLTDGVSFDLGNAMAEYALDYSIADAPGFLAHWPSGYPSLEWQTALFGAWAEGAGLRRGPSQAEHVEGDVGARTNLHARELGAQFTDPLLRQVAWLARAGLLHSHLFWAAWAFIMARSRRGGKVRVGWGEGQTSRGLPQFELPSSGHSVFSYEKYGRARLAEYIRLRDAVDAVPLPG